MSTRSTPTSLRLPVDLMEWVDQKAKEGDRSRTRQIERIVRQARAAEQAEQSGGA